MLDGITDIPSACYKVNKMSLSSLQLKSHEYVFSPFILTTITDPPPNPPSLRSRDESEETEYFSDRNRDMVAIDTSTYESLFTVTNPKNSPSRTQISRPINEKSSLRVIDQAIASSRQRLLNKYKSPSVTQKPVSMSQSFIDPVTMPIEEAATLEETLHTYPGDRSRRSLGAYNTVPHATSSSGAHTTTPAVPPTTSSLGAHTTSFIGAHTTTPAVPHTTSSLDAVTTSPAVGRNTSRISAISHTPGSVMSDGDGLSLGIFTPNTITPVPTHKRVTITTNHSVLSHKNDEDALTHSLTYSLTHSRKNDEDDNNSVDSITATLSTKALSNNTPNDMNSSRITSGYSDEGTPTYSNSNSPESTEKVNDSMRVIAGNTLMSGGDNLKSSSGTPKSSGGSTRSGAVSTGARASVSPEVPSPQKSFLAGNAGTTTTTAAAATTTDVLLTSLDEEYRKRVSAGTLTHLLLTHSLSYSLTHSLTLLTHVANENLILQDEINEMKLQHELVIEDYRNQINQFNRQVKALAEEVIPYYLLTHSLTHSFTH